MTLGAMNLKKELARVEWPPIRDAILTCAFVIGLGLLGGTMLFVIDTVLSVMSQRAVALL